MSSLVLCVRAILSASIRADLKKGSGERLSNRSEGMARVGRIIKVSKMSKEMILTSRGMDMDVKERPRRDDRSMRALVFNVPTTLLNPSQTDPLCKLSPGNHPVLYHTDSLR